MLPSSTKWLLHTILIGIIPVLARLLTWAATSTGNIAPLAAADFITLGLLIHVSIINEMRHLLMRGAALRAELNGMSALFITFYGTLHALATIGERNTELINTQFVLLMSIAFCIGSTVLGFGLFQISQRRWQ